MNRQPTPEQAAVLDVKPIPGSVAMIDAVAGSGKTTTVEMYATNYPTISFLYLCFNKAQAEEAKQRFPVNATCQTTHSLAFGQTGRLFTRNKAKPFGREPRAKGIMGPLDVYDVVDAQVVIRTLTNYLQSAQPKLGHNHLPSHTRNWEFDEQRKVLAKAELLWQRMIDPKDAEIPISHDGYLKQWQVEILLSGHLPRVFDRYQGILIDEAQDTNPAFEIILRHIIEAGRHMLIVVGDERQSIYQWRGAVNMMSRLRTALEEGSVRGERKMLTESFRYGPRTARFASEILAIGNEKSAIEIVGRGIDQETSQGAQCYLARTNAGLVERALEVLQDRKEVIHFAATKAPGWSPALPYKFDFIRSVYGQFANQSYLITDPDVRRFADWSEILEHAKTEAPNDDQLLDQELATAVRFVEKYQHSVPQVLNRLEVSCASPAEATISFSTAHRAKGLEWERTTLLDDFPPLPTESMETGQKPPDEQELNLLYVAITRAKHWVQLNNNLTEFFAGSAFKAIDSDDDQDTGNGDDDEAEQQITPQTAGHCQRCGNSLCVEDIGPRGELLGWIPDESLNLPGFCTWCADQELDDD